ncbi:MAG: FG-GAP repeat domain-containing protein, partial [bacterium]
MALALWSSGAVGQVLQPGFDPGLLGETGGSRAFGVAIADFTSDGTSDVVAGDTAGDVRLFAGRGDGTFEARGRVVDMSFTDAFGLTVGDFDRDGFQDFMLGRASSLGDGEVLLYLGRGDGTFEKSGFPELGLVIGDAGDEAVVLATADVDGDGDLDVVAGDVSTGPGDTADVVLFRNQLEVLGGALAFVPEVILSGVDRGFSPDPEDPPYFPPDSGFSWEAYGLAFGDADADGDPDLLLLDQAHYLYVYSNDGSGGFEPIRYENVGGRPFAFERLDPTGFAPAQAALAAGDLNSDGLVDLAVSFQNGSVGSGPGEVFVWVGEGVDQAGRPTFSGAGLAGAAGTDVRGLAIGQLDPEVDLLPDILFGNFQGELWGLFADLTDSDGDGIIDDVDNAPLIFNPPVVDMNTDGSLNRFDQLDADDDGTGDPTDADDDDDGVSDERDNCVLTANSSQSDRDADGLGDACDPRNDLDEDGDGVTDGPFDPDLRVHAIAAKARWARSDTHFVIRIDALSRAFQNEFTQVFTDAGILDPASWE